MLSQIYNAIGRVDISPMGDYGADKRLDKIMKILLFRDRLRKNKCISCGEETPASYLEKGEDVVSSPVCQECLQKGLDPDVVKFIEKSGLGSTVMPHFEELMDPRKMERKFPYQGSEEYEED